MLPSNGDLSGKILYILHQYLTTSCFMVLPGDTVVRGTLAQICGKKKENNGIS